MRSGTPGGRRDLGSSLRTAREIITGMRGGGRRVGEMSRCTDAPRPGKLGGVEAGAIEISGAAPNGNRSGTVFVRSRGVNEYPERV